MVYGAILLDHRVGTFIGRREVSNPHICETNLAQIVVILVTVLTQQVFLVILEDTEVSLAAVTFDIFCVWTHFKC